MDTPEERAAWAKSRMGAATRLDSKSAAQVTRANSLKRLERPVRVALVGCGMKKRSAPCRARDLYSGALTRAAIRYAERHSDEFWILSAFHELLSPDQTIEPYDRRLPTRKAERQAWGHRVSGRLAEQYIGLKVFVEVLAGADYSDSLAFLPDWTVTYPLDGLALGERLRWLSQHAR